MRTAAAGRTSAQSIARPGRTVHTSLAELLEVDDNTDVVVEWRERMREIEESERSAENEEAAVRIR